MHGITNLKLKKKSLKMLSRIYSRISKGWLKMKVAFVIHK